METKLNSSFKRMPKKLGKSIDNLYVLRQHRLLVQKEVDSIRDLERTYEEHILHTFTGDEIEGARGVVATASRNISLVATVADWDKVFAYVKRHNAFDLIQKRINNAAARERWDDNKEIPGVEQFDRVTLSLRKR